MHRAPCHILSLDVVDVTGVHIMDVGGTLYKHRLDPNGHYLGLHDLVRYRLTDTARWMKTLTLQT